MLIAQKNGAGIVIFGRIKSKYMKFILSTIIALSATLSFSQSKFDEVFSHISEKYVDTVDTDKLMDDAIVAMLEELDPHSTYISKADVEDANRGIRGNFVGVGIRFQILKDTLVVVQTIQGGPSARTGVLAGDKIIKVDNENIASIGLKNSMVRERLLGDKGTKVDLEIVRNGSKKPLKFTITRDVIPLNSVDAYYMVTPQTGYIKLSSFSRSSHRETVQAINNLKAEGMQNLILDLQNNGGGLMHASKLIADEFLSENKLLVYSEGRAQPRQNLKAKLFGNWEDGRLAILTNEYSASASEIVSGAVQDWDRGIVVGRRTFGKGLVQRPINLSDGSQIRLTIARYYTPSGRFIQKPYEDNDEYHKDLTNRYKEGEFMDVNKIKLPDSLKRKTLIKKRTVYGGGGIMPDFFVPIDTSGVNKLFSQPIRSGKMNEICLEYVNSNRDDLKNQYPVFPEFKSKYEVSDEFVKKIILASFADEEDFEIDEELYKEAEYLLKLRIKSKIAQNLWGIQEFIKVYNESNEVLQSAIEIIESSKYKKAKLAN